MGQNSFLIKGWTITIVAALIALGAKDSRIQFILVAYFPTAVFWGLDGYYLYQERLFRKVYDAVRTHSVPTDFSLSTKSFDKGFTQWADAVISKTIWPLYATILFTITIVAFTVNPCINN